jgi:predicted transcriptional regulator
MKYSPQEIEVWYVLPEVRKQLALALKKQGLSQKEIAEKLNVTPATVSHYAKNKRAGNFDLGTKIQKHINVSAKAIANTKSQMLIMEEIQRICDEIRKTFTLCKIHRNLDKVPKCCKICRGIEK